MGCVEENEENENEENENENENEENENENENEDSESEDNENENEENENEEHGDNGDGNSAAHQYFPTAMPLTAGTGPVVPYEDVLHLHGTVTDQRISYMQQSVQPQYGASYTLEGGYNGKGHSAPQVNQCFPNAAPHQYFPTAMPLAAASVSGTGPVVPHEYVLHGSDYAVTDQFTSYMQPQHWAAYPYSS